VAAESLNSNAIAANATNIALNSDAAALANAKADTLATFSKEDGTASTAADGTDITQASMKAVDASNVKAGQDSTGLGEELDQLQQDKESGNGFLDFFKKLFGSDEDDTSGSN
jgi:hypothetical protein